MNYPLLMLLITKIYMTYNSNLMCTWQPSHRPRVFPIFCDKRGLVLGATAISRHVHIFIERDNAMLDYDWGGSRGKMG